MTHSINVIDHDGNHHKLEATVGFSIMEIIREAGLDIEAICGGCCACATCHCYIDDNWKDKLSTLHPLTLDSGASSDLLCMLRRKTYNY